MTPTELRLLVGQILYQPGEPGDRAFQVLDGEVEVTPLGATRATVHGPGEVFDEVSLVAEHSRRATARARTAARLRVVTRPAFEKLLADDPQAAFPFLKALFERIRASAGQVAVAEPEADAGEPTRSPVPTAPVELPTDAAAPPARSVVIYPLTRLAAENLPENGLRVTKFPLRVGRVAAGGEPEPLDLNDLWLVDDVPYSVSRNHCAIDLDRSGNVAVLDRGSQLGCLVNDEPIGGRTGRLWAVLRPGQNVLVLGGPSSRYQFRVAVDQD